MWSNPTVSWVHHYTPSGYIFWFLQLPLQLLSNVILWFQLIEAWSFNFTFIITVTRHTQFHRCRDFLQTNRTFLSPSKCNIFLTFSYRTESLSTLFSLSSCMNEARCGSHFLLNLVAYKEENLHIHSLKGESEMSHTDATAVH